MMINKQNSKHYKWGNDCDLWVFHESKNLSVKYESMPPNTSEVLHYHSNAHQFFYILKGEAIFQINNDMKRVNSNEGISIKPKKNHSIQNKTNDLLEFLVMSSPNADNDKIKVEP